jgi:hypothetical protein
MNLQENINRIQEMMGIINEDSNMKEMIFDMINDAVKGADLYEHEGSLWLIFTDDKEWVIKLNKNGVLWYDYDFFNIIFKYLSLDVVENQHYITEWVEDTIKNGVKYTRISTRDIPQFIEDTIKNGVKYTIYDFKGSNIPVEDTIKNGVKYTIEHQKEAELTVEDTIKNGENLGNIKNG